MLRRRIRTAATTAAALLCLVSLATALSMGDKDDKEPENRADELYRAGNRLAEQGKYEDALGRFEQANRERADDPEILNMLAYCQRKTGHLDAAFANYRRALQLRPEFPQAREYLGEAHLQAALAELAVLRGYGETAAEETRTLADAVRRAAAELDASAADTAPAADGKKTGRRW